MATSPSERQKFCDGHFLELMVVLMRNDSASYTFVEQPQARAKLDVEFYEANALMRRELNLIE